VACGIGIGLRIGLGWVRTACLGLSRVHVARCLEADDTCALLIHIVYSATPCCTSTLTGTEKYVLR